MFTKLKLDLESTPRSICLMIWYYIIITDGIHMHYHRGWISCMTFVPSLISSSEDTMLISRRYYVIFFFPYFRRIYPPDDKSLLEKYESLLATAFQTFLAGRAASLQREMNNPLKRMKVLMHRSLVLKLFFLEFSSLQITFMITMCVGQ